MEDGVSALGSWATFSLQVKASKTELMLLICGGVEVRRPMIRGA